VGKSVLWMLLGIVLLVSGIYLMTRVNRKSGKEKYSRKLSVLLSIVEFFLDFGIGLFTGGLALGAGSLAVVMVIVGFFMTLINLMAIIH